MYKRLTKSERLALGMVERILDEIDKRGLTCNAVEQTLGFGNGALKRFATSSPSIDKIIRLADFFDVSIDWLVSGQGLKAPIGYFQAGDAEMINEYHRLDFQGKTNVRNAICAEEQRMEITLQQFVDNLTPPDPATIIAYSGAATQLRVTPEQQERIEALVKSAEEEMGVKNVDGKSETLAVKPKPMKKPLEKPKK